MALSVAFAAPAAAQDPAPRSFDFYVLALSWAPTYCANAADRGRPNEECAPGAKLGFVLHGLWPQNEHGYPSDCDGAGRVPRYVLDATGGLYPSVGLEIHEWRAHGSCTGLSPTAYFDAVKRARDLVHVPADFQAVQQGRPTTAIDVARAFIDANPGLRPGMAAVTCRRDQLEETRICLTKDLRGFRACPEVARDQCSAASIRIPAPQ